MVVIPRHSDRTGERKRHVTACLLVAAAAFAISTVVSPVAAIGALAVGLFFLLGVHGVFWTMRAALLGGTAAAAGIAMINSIGNLGGFGGPYFVGLLKDATGSTDGGLIGLAAILVIGSFVATRVVHDPERERAPRERTGRFTRTETRVPQTVR
jgi:nitrate/nitrite transporter NarK